MARRKIRRKKTPDQLPQKPEIWQVAFRELRTWIVPPDEEPYRPFGMLVLNLTREMIQGLKLFEFEPEPDEVATQLMEVIRHPEKHVSRKGYRPKEIRFDNEHMAEALKERFAAWGIRLTVAPLVEVAGHIFNDFEEHLRGGPDIPGLLSVPGVTPELIGDLFEAAAALYRAAPWERISDEHTFAITVPPEKKPRFLKLMGYAGIQYGLATYKRWEDIEQLYMMVDDVAEGLPEDGGHSFLFHDVTTTPFDDLEAIEEYGWEVAGEEAYPVPVVFHRDGSVSRPTKQDLLWYRAAIRGLLAFLEKHLKPRGVDKFQDTEADVTVDTHAGQVRVHIRYPGGTLPPELRPVLTPEWGAADDDEDDDLPPLPDRRAMEGMMRVFGGGSFDDPALNEAQDLMYQAWEETNPARRINLAHRALSISEHCADAYVLLAEEEADNIARALELYKKGMEAGERALGKDYFEKYEGHFWGLLETRPYMRAREGYARFLAQIGRTEEAIEHYRDMLRLNPADNQGNRYALLALLLQSNRFDQAQTLLDQYAEDGLADFVYTRALLAFRKHGDSPEARAALQEALEVNEHVPLYLTGRRAIPVKPPEYIVWGGHEEAILYAGAHLPHWRRIRGALAWLETQTGLGKKPKRKKRTKRGRRGSRRKKS